MDRWTIASRTAVGSSSREGVIVDVGGGEGDWSENFAALRKQVENETSGDYLAFRRSLSPRFGVVWFHLLLAWLFVIAFAAALVVAQHRLTTPWVVVVVPIGSLALGMSFHFIGLFLHEAAHGGLAPTRSTNDALANIFVAALLLTDIRAYRPVHLEHHRFLGTDRDSERTYTSRLTPGFVVSTISGLHALRVIRVRSSLETPGAQQSRHRLVPCAGVLAHAALVGGALALGWWWLAGAWAIAIFSWFPCFGAVRQVLEHRPPPELRGDASSGALGAYTREFSGHPANAIFGGAGFNRHLIHHWEPGVSYTRLADLERFLEGTSAGAVIARRRATYFGTFRALVATGG